MSDQAPGASGRLPVSSRFFVVLARWPLVLVFLLLGAGTGYLIYSYQSPIYESTARLQISKRFDATKADRGLFFEDYVATITQLILSDAMLEEVAKKLESAPLQYPIMGDLQDQTDLLRRIVRVIRERDPFLIGGSSQNTSVILVKCQSLSYQDSQLILDTLLSAVQEYLTVRHDDAHTIHIVELDAKIAHSTAELRKLEVALTEQSQELLQITDEDLADVRSRMTANHHRILSLQLELASVTQELQTLADIHASPSAKAAKRREILQTLKPEETRGSDAALQQLLITRQNLSRKLVVGHPRLISLDQEIDMLQAASASAPSEVMENFAKREVQLQGRKSQLDVQRGLVEQQIKADTNTLSRGSKLQTQIAIIRKQQEEEVIEIRRLQERKTAMALSKDSSRAFDARVTDRPRQGVRVAPSLKAYLLGGSIFGAVLGSMLALLLEYFSQSRKRQSESHFQLGIPVLGQVPPIQIEAPALTTICVDGYDPSLVTALRPKSLESEVYRGLRTRLLVAVSPTNYRIIQVTSPNPGEGKSTTAANLAISLAQTGLRILLIDADLRRPRQHILFGLPNCSKGLTSVLDGSSDLPDTVLSCAVPNLFLLPAGPPVESPADLLAGAGFKAALSFLRERFDHIVLDTPPLFAVSDPLVVARCADAAILVMRPSRNGHSKVERAKEYLAENGVKVIGVVANEVKGHTQAYYESCTGIPQAEDDDSITTTRFHNLIKKTFW